MKSAEQAVAASSHGTDNMVLSGADFQRYEINNDIVKESRIFLFYEQDDSTLYWVVLNENDTAPFSRVQKSEQSIKLESISDIRLVGKCYMTWDKKQNGDQGEAEYSELFCRFLFSFLLFVFLFLLEWVDKPPPCPARLHPNWLIMNVFPLLMRMVIH